MSKRKRNFGFVKWLIFLILITGAVAVVILIKNNIFDDSKEKRNENINNTSNIVEVKDESRKEEAKKEETKEQATTENKDKAPQYEGASPNTAEVLTGLITYADVVDNELLVRVNIDQYLQSGSCNMTMSRNGVSYYNISVAILESVSTSTCDGFKIPVNELPGGDLQIEISLQSGDRNGKIVGKVKI